MRNVSDLTKISHVIVGKTGTLTDGHFSVRMLLAKREAFKLSRKGLLRRLGSYLENEKDLDYDMTGDQPPVGEESYGKLLKLLLEEKDEAIVCAVTAIAICVQQVSVLDLKKNQIENLRASKADSAAVALAERLSYQFVC